jgi:hypothetical protein
MPVVVASFLFAAFVITVSTVGKVLIARANLRAAEGPARLQGDSQRIERIEQIVETMAIEIERISEAQRFTTKLLADRRPDEAPAGRGREHERQVTPH